MPIYEYSCPECETLFEEWQTGFEERTQPCPECGAESRRIISNTSFVLKGSGWYVTDYASKKPSVNGKSQASATSGTNGDGKANDSASPASASDASGSAQKASTGSDSAGKSSGSSGSSNVASSGSGASAAK